MTPAHLSAPALSPQSMADLFCTIMLLCHGKHPNGKPFWAYICIKPSMAKAFKEARDKGNINLEDYGTIIEWGDGADVPADIKTRMARDYGANHQYEHDLIKAVDILKKSEI